FAMSATTLTLTPEEEAFARAEVEVGRASSVEEVAHEALRLMAAHRRKAEAFYAHVQEGIDDADAGRLVEVPTAEELIEEAMARRAGHAAE
ncbi:MAG: type II toxin-antitoxin system ParD family antitoxin, partial [Pseudomonadota bacterium]